MTNTFKNKVAVNVGTSSVDVYTVPASTTTTVIGLSIANTTSSQIAVDVKLYDNSVTTSAFLIKGALVPPNGTINIAGGDQKIILETLDKIQVLSNTASSADVILSMLEQA